jgi:hypothetical protein
VVAQHYQPDHQGRCQKGPRQPVWQEQLALHLGRAAIPMDITPIRLHDEDDNKRADGRGESGDDEATESYIIGLGMSELSPEGTCWVSS